MSMLNLKLRQCKKCKKHSWCNVIDGIALCRDCLVSEIMELRAQVSLLEVEIQTEENHE